MRLAVLSDLHGNLPALNAIEADLARRGGADLIVNAGDLLSGPLWPRETAERLMARGWLSIAGNHERQLLACGQHPGDASDAHAWAQTSEAQRAWIAGLPPTRRLLHGTVLVCHGTPDHDHLYLMETVGPQGSRAATPEEVDARLAGVDLAQVGLVVCGHSHLPRLMQRPRSPASPLLCLNPGSAGLPAYDDDHGGCHVHQTGSPHARYALCESTVDGGWTVALIAVDYDWRSAAAQAERQGAPDWARWLASGLA